MSNPLITVVVPMFNAEATIGDCLRSLVNQSFHNWEAVIVDDGSRDTSAEIVSCAARHEPRIRLIRQPNLGVSEARNAGVAAARGEWVRFLDADDWLLERSHESLLNTAQTSHAPMIAAGVRCHDQAGSDLGWSFAPGIPSVSLESLVESDRFQVGGAMLRRELFRETAFRSAVAEDLDVWLRLCERGFAWTCTDTDVAAYRLRPSSLSRDHTLMARVATEVVASCFDRCPWLEGNEPGRRDRCLRRIALERAHAFAFERGTAEGLGLWRSLRGESCTSVSPSQAAAAALWSIPFADCMPPTAWRENARAARYLCSVTELWGALHVEPIAALSHLAVLLVEPRETAARIASNLSEGDHVVLHGLGRNASVLAPLLLARGARIEGRDRAAEPGSIVQVGGVRIPVAGTADREPIGTHVLTPWHAPAMEASIPAGCLKWREAASEISRAGLRRLLALAPVSALVGQNGRAA